MVKEETAVASTSSIADPKTDVAAYLLRLQSALQPLTRDAAQLPAHGDLAFHRSMDRKLAKKLDEQADRILHRITELASWIAADPLAPKVPLLSEKGGKQRALTHADVATKESFTSNLGELVDHLLESADICLDEYAGKVAPRNLSGAAADASKPSTNESKTLPKEGPLPQRILNASIQPPPQHSFTTKADNSADTLWSRKLRFGKPNAVVPLDHVNQPPINADGETLLRGPRRGMYCAEGDPLDNPYYHEIMHATAPNHALTHIDQHWLKNPPPPINEKDPSLSTDASPFIWVTTKAQIEALRDHLQEDRVTEIAIDLEHHAFRTYQGIVCLMQLSTRWGDWIIDTLSDEVRENAELLNTSFTDPNKVKVLHGANHDVLWLQRDLGLYLVNLFDTYHATNVLMFPSHGLAYLMVRYCSFDADKRYQLADWRIRPLPREMLYYARSDTHTLLYIYDNLRHELMQSQGVDGIRTVFELSKDVANAVYAKEEWDEEGENREGWRNLWRRWGGAAAIDTELRINVSDMKKEERLVRALHRWRDGVARQEDESPRYVLGATNLMMLATRAPTTPQAVLPCIPPNAAILKKRTKEIAAVISQEVAAWQADQSQKEEAQKQKLAKGLETASATADVDVGETIARPTQVEVALISAQSSAAASTPVIDASIWSAAPQSTAVAPSKSLFGGAVRSFASNLFGNKPKPATSTQGKTTLTSASSKLFGGSSLMTAAARKVTDQVESVKATFANDVATMIRPAPDAKQVESPQPETIAFVPLEQNAPVPDSNTASTRIDSEDDQNSIEPKQDYIVVSASSSKSKKKSKHSSTPDSGKKRKQPPTPASEQKVAKKKLFDGEFDFAAAPSSVDSKSTFESAPEPAPPVKTKTSRNKDKKNQSNNPSPANFRQPRDRARKNVGAGATL